MMAAMSTQLPAIHIFRPGRHVAMSGQVLEFTEADLQAAAAAYDPAVHEAPIVVGHPKTDAPAYGWVGGLEYGEDGLHAVPAQVEPEFAELVRAGRFKKVSASFYPPAHPGNPAPGAYYLKHVGFLGAAAPALKGLKQVEFAGGEDGVVTVEFSEEWALARLFRSLREWLIGQHGVDAAEAAVPGYLVESLDRASLREEMAPPVSPVSAFSESQADPAGESAGNPPDGGDSEMTDAERQRLQALEEENRRLREEQASFAEREQAVAAQEAAARHREIVEFVDGLVRDGRVLPRDKDGLAAFMTGPNEAGVIEFGEGDDAQTPQASEWLRQFLANLPKVVDFAERGAPTEENDAASFAAPDGYGVDPQALEVHRQAMAHLKAHPGTDYLAAVQAVTKA